MASANSSTLERIIVGLDFGTTYSGVAWASTRHPDLRETVTEWPGDYHSDKVPTKLRYVAGETQWGFGVPLDVSPGEVVEWFKLDLDPSLLPLKQAVADRAVDRGVDAVVADYISALLTHFTTILAQKLGREIPSSALDLVLAVPAIWSDAAKTRTRQICERVSGAPVHLVSEPEAAAAHVIRELDPRELDAGDTVVVVDAGGGTVDLTSYTVRALDHLEVEEAAPATGALCGAAFLDMRFTKYLRAKLGNLEGFDEGVVAGAVTHFEEGTKRLVTVDATEGATYPIPVPKLHDHAPLNIANGTYALPDSDLRTIFEPVILETTKLVTEHVSALPAAPKAILLVGGFGGSDYLHGRLKMALSEVNIPRPHDAWRAVAQGAVMMGLAGVQREYLKSEKTVRRYGVELVARYDEKLHFPIRRKRYWCGLDGCYKVYVMHWFAEGPNEDTRLQTTFHWASPVSKGRVRTVSLDIYAREAAGPPPLSRDHAVTPLRRVEADLSAVPQGELKRRRGLDGRWYYDLRCGIEKDGTRQGRYTLVYKGG